MQEDIIKPVIGNHLEECNDFPVLAKECREEDDIIAYRRLSGICLQEEDLSRISFEHVIFENCRMIHSSFSGGNLQIRSSGPVNCPTVISAVPVSAAQRFRQSRASGRTSTKRVSFM